MLHWILVLEQTLHHAQGSRCWSGGGGGWFSMRNKGLEVLSEGSNQPGHQPIGTCWRHGGHTHEQSPTPQWECSLGGPNRWAKQGRKRGEGEGGSKWWQCRREGRPVKGHRQHRRMRWGESAQSNADEWLSWFDQQWMGALCVEPVKEVPSELQTWLQEQWHSLQLPLFC